LTKKRQPFDQKLNKIQPFDQKLNKIQPFDQPKFCSFSPQFAIYIHTHSCSSSASPTFQNMFAAAAP